MWSNEQTNMNARQRRASQHEPRPVKSSPGKPLFFGQWSGLASVVAMSDHGRHWQYHRDMMSRIDIDTVVQELEGDGTLNDVQLAFSDDEVVGENRLSAAEVLRNWDSEFAGAGGVTNILNKEPIIKMKGGNDGGGRGGGGGGAVCMCVCVWGVGGCLLCKSNRLRHVRAVFFKSMFNSAFEIGIVGLFVLACTHMQGKCSRAKHACHNFGNCQICRALRISFTHAHPRAA